MLCLEPQTRPTEQGRGSQCILELGSNAQEELSAEVLIWSHSSFLKCPYRGAPSSASGEKQPLAEGSSSPHLPPLAGQEIRWLMS